MELDFEPLFAQAAAAKKLQGKYKHPCFSPGIRLQFSLSMNTVDALYMLDGLEDDEILDIINELNQCCQ